MDMRRQGNGSVHPSSIILAADARLTRTSYTDDQVWELYPGSGEAPALTLQTRYGGRASLASLVPMWQHQGRSIYEARTYAQPPIITSFAPGYVRTDAQLIPGLSLQAEYWAINSSAIGARYMLHNQTGQEQSFRLDLFGHVIVEGRPQKLAILSLSDDTSALSLGRLARLEPVVVMEGAGAEIIPGFRTSPKIGLTLTLEPDETRVVRWVHSGQPAMAASLAVAQHWLEEAWDAQFERIANAARAVPVIETGSAEMDHVIALSFHTLMQSFLSAEDKLPHPSIVATRQPGRGFSSRGDGSDYDRNWNGQHPALVYLVALAAASVDPVLAAGLLKNYLAVQTADGWIDYKPGPAGQRADMLCLPLLARLAWNLYQQTNDRDFLKEAFSPLLKFMRRWSKSDVDTEFDGLPEWRDERQTGYTAWPTFSAGGPWTQGADIRFFETPDMAAYQLSEARSLQAIAQELGDAIAGASLNQRIEILEKHLDQLWHENRYAYRDRDTNTISARQIVLEASPGDEEAIPSLELSPAMRLIVTVQGGAGKAPAATLQLEGLDEHGKNINDRASTGEFHWTYGSGVYTSRRVFSRVDRVRFTGLSRVYRFSVSTVDTTRLDINALLPLWTGGIPKKKAAALVKWITNKDHFWRASGLSIVSAQDPNYDPTSANGGGGVWLYWATLIGEGLAHYGEHRHAVELVKRILTMQSEVLKTQRHFSEFYHSDEAHGLGEDSHLAGIAPLHLLMLVLGIRVMSHTQVWAGGPFAWGGAVTVHQHGVTVVRSKNGIRVSFPSGHIVELGPDAPYQRVDDPSPNAQAEPQHLPEHTAPFDNNRVIIKIDEPGSPGS